MYQERKIITNRFLVLDKRFIFKMPYMDAQILTKKTILHIFTNRSKIQR